MTQLRLRGAEANHVVVLIDGIEVSAAGSGEFDFSSLLSADIERIEVLRGPQSGLYGSNALAGVISIHTRSPVEGFSADVSLEGGSHDTRSGSVSISGGNAQVQGRTRLRASYGRGVTNPTFFEQFGFVPGTFVGNPGLEPEKSVGWDIGVEHEFGEGEWQLDVTYFDADLENEIRTSSPFGSSESV